MAGTFSDIPPLLEEHLERGVTADRTFNDVLAAGLVAVQYLGDVFGPEVDGATGRVHYEWGLRVVSLGEALFLLRSHSSFEEFCRRLKQRDFRGAYFEAHIAKTFLDAGFLIKVLPESGRKGADFDIAATRDGQTLSIEVTALADGPPSETTLANALEQKRKQLPKDSPSVIFCLLHKAWGTSAGITAVDQCVTTFLSRTQRINAVVLLLEEHIPVEGGVDLTAVGYGVRNWKHLSPRNPADVSFLDVEPFSVPTFYANGRRLVKVRQSEFYRWVDEITANAMKLSNDGPGAAHLQAPLDPIDLREGIACHVALSPPPPLSDLVIVFDMGLVEGPRLTLWLTSHGSAVFRYKHADGVEVQAIAPSVYDLEPENGVYFVSAQIVVQPDARLEVWLQRKLAAFRTLPFPLSGQLTGEVRIGSDLEGQTPAHGLSLMHYAYGRPSSREQIINWTDLASKFIVNMRRG